MLDNNITAPWWVIVRDGSVSPKNYICPQTSDATDRLTVSTTDGAVADLKNTFDFLERKNLSWSPMNLYHPLVRDRWGPDANADWVFMADNNANDYTEAPPRHTLSKGAAREDVEKAENSPNHGYKGQNIMFGDGHVSFASDPFQGPAGDNIYAFAAESGNIPPTILRTAGNASDVVLVPLSGNGGGAGSLSGLAMDVTWDVYARRSVFPWGFVGVGAIVILIALWMIQIIRGRWGADRSLDPPAGG